MAEASAHEFGALNTLLVVFLLAMVLLVGYLLKKYKFYYVPESAAAMMLGMVVGGVARLVYPAESELSFLRFQPELFFFLLLPPIIFEAGFTLKKKRFFRNFSSITLYAVLGTIISTFLIGMLVYAFAKAGAIKVDATSPLQSLLFGALISAVDPVATLAIMGTAELNCNKMLYSLVFGESVLNDAVAIVLFRTFANLTTRGSVDLNSWTSYALLIGEFVGISLGSIVVGCIVALACSAMCFHTNLRQYPAKLTAMFLFAYAAYAISEAIDLSGIMALFFCGIVMSHYAWHNLSDESQVSSHDTFKSFAWTTETIVFVYMGMVLFTGEFSSWDPLFIFLAILFCLLARAANIFPISWCVNCRRKRKIPMKMQIVMWFAGLRGAIAFALALNMPNIEGKWDNQVIGTTTLCIVIFTTVICGGLTEPMLKKMGMQEDEEEPTPAPGTTRRIGGIHKLWKFIDINYMKPVFGGEAESGGMYREMGGSHLDDHDPDGTELAMRSRHADLNGNGGRASGLGAGAAYTPPNHSGGARGQGLRSAKDMQHPLARPGSARSAGSSALGADVDADDLDAGDIGSGRFGGSSGAAAADAGLVDVDVHAPSPQGGAQHFGRL